MIFESTNTTIMNLHNHHTQHHSSVELSQTIVNLEGYKLLNTMNNVENRCLKPRNVGDNNNNIHDNNENLYNPNVNQTENNKKLGHDKASCLVKCSQFIPWEHELNKRKEINDEEFVNVVEELCCDLSKKRRRGRKRKSEIDNTKIKNPVKDVQNENITDSRNKITNNSDAVPPQVSTATASSCNPKSSTDTTVENNDDDDDIIILETKKAVDTENNNSVILPLNNIDTNRKVLIYDPATGKFSWGSIMYGISFQNQVSTC